MKLLLHSTALPWHSASKKTVSVTVLNTITKHLKRHNLWRPDHSNCHSPWREMWEKTPLCPEFTPNSWYLGQTAETRRKRETGVNAHNLHRCPNPGGELALAQEDFRIRKDCEPTPLPKTYRPRESQNTEGKGQELMGPQHGKRKTGLKCAGPCYLC